MNNGWENLFFENFHFFLGQKSAFVGKGIFCRSKKEEEEFSGFLFAMKKFVSLTNSLLYQKGESPFSFPSFFSPPLSLFFLESHFRMKSKKSEEREISRVQQTISFRMPFPIFQNSVKDGAEDQDEKAKQERTESPKATGKISNGDFAVSAASSSSPTSMASPNSAGSADYLRQAPISSPSAGQRSPAASALFTNGNKLMEKFPLLAESSPYVIWSQFKKYNIF